MDGSVPRKRDGEGCLIMKRTKVIWTNVRFVALAAGVAGLSLASPASAAASLVSLGSSVPSTSGPPLPSPGLSVSRCGYQVPNDAIVHSDGSVTDAAGNALAANVVCSYADVAANTSSHRTTSTAKASGTLAPASI